MYWIVRKESKVYKYKDLTATLKELPPLPKNISEMMGWFAGVLTTLASFDMSDSGIISHWWAMLENPTGHI